MLVEPSSIAAALGELPLLGALLGKLHPLVWISWLLFAASPGSCIVPAPASFCERSGESPSSAYAIGYPVIGIRYLATLFGGAMAGVAGAYMSIIYTALWTEGLTAGRGWIAVALVVFATWRPGRALLGAYLFGGVTTIQLFAQGAGVPVPPELMSAAPYIATILVLVLISRDVNLIRLNVPASLGKPFHAECLKGNRNNQMNHAKGRETAMYDISRRRFVKGAAAGAALSAAGGARALLAANEVLKVGIIHQGAISDTGWEYFQAKASKALEAAYPDKVKTTVIENIQQNQDAERLFRQLASPRPQTAVRYDVLAFRVAEEACSERSARRISSAVPASRRATISVFSRRATTKALTSPGSLPAG